MLKIALIQSDIVWVDPVRNRERLEVLLASEKADLYVLPEMFSTGFATEPKGIAESDGSTLLWMKRMASRLDAALAGSIAIEHDCGYANRFYFVKPSGQVTTYDKRHLFAYGGENLFFTAGDERVVVEWRGIRFLLQVCYDLRFPVWSRNRGDYDAVLYVANWPTPRIDVWKTLLKARALENQCFVVGVNRVGKDPACDYCGCSVMHDARGRVLAACTYNQQGVAVGEVDMDSLQLFRQKFPVLADADAFQLG